MKTITIFLCIFFIAACVSAKESAYTGSTPAAKVVRAFLGVSLTDSIDFVRWQLTVKDNSYTLSCNYGISKPNTNGFINGGEKVSFRGTLNREKNIYQLKHGNKILKLVELNEDLLQLTDEKNNFLVGNGGWSYTLNNLKPAITDQLSTISQQTLIKDSIVYEGRTPCGVPGIIPAGMDCYKLKWLITLYPDAQKKGSGTYKVFGTPYRKQGGKTGNWQITRGTDNHILYRLNDDKGNGFIYLLQVSNAIAVFTNADGKLLVGNEDFSYTLNKVE